MLIHWSKITPRFFTDPLWVIEDVPICNAGVFRDLTQCGDFESSIAEYQQYKVLNSSRKRRNLTNCQDPGIYTAVCHQHTSDI